MGRGPTMLISPRATLSRLGSSSSEMRRSHATDRGDAVVIGEDRVVPVGHRAELDHVEGPAVASDALLAEQDRAGRREAHGDGARHGDQRGRHRDEGQQDEVDEPLAAVGPALDRSTVMDRRGRPSTRRSPRRPSSSGTGIDLGEQRPDTGVVGHGVAHVAGPGLDVVDRQRMTDDRLEQARSARAGRRGCRRRG